MTNKADRTNKANTTQENAYEDEKRGVSDKMRGFRPTKSDPLALLRLQRANSKEKARGLGLIWGLSGCRH